MGEVLIYFVKVWMEHAFCINCPFRLVTMYSKPGECQDLPRRLRSSHLVSIFLRGNVLLLLTVVVVIVLLLLDVIVYTCVGRSTVNPRCSSVASQLLKFETRSLLGPQLRQVG